MSKSRYAWVLVAVLWFVWLLNYIDRQIIYSVFPLLRSDLRLSDLQLGLLSTSFLWVYALVSPAMGYLGDRLRRKNVIVGSLAFWSAVLFFRLDLPAYVPPVSAGSQGAMKIRSL